jgi:hypothetical protein
VSGLKFFPLVPILRESNFERQITVEQDKRNELSENRTVIDTPLADFHSLSVFHPQEASSSRTCPNKLD